MHTHGHTAFHTLRAIRYVFFHYLQSALNRSPSDNREKLSQVTPLISKQPAPADNMSIFYTIGVRHSKSRTVIVWKMSY